MPASSEILPGDVDVAAFDRILDVRPTNQRSLTIQGSVSAPIDELLSEQAAFIPGIESAVLVLCDIGMRSAIARTRLTEAGYSAVRSLAGGIDAWRAADLPVVGAAGLSPAQLDRYDRHLKLPGFGAAGQAKLLASTVAVVGAGGLGVPVIEYLAAAGVGTIRCIDPDTIEVSNLQRQPAYRTHDIGAPKVDAMHTFVRNLNEEVTFEEHQSKLDVDNADALLANSDVIIDATDTFDARYAISDAGVRLRTPVVTGAVYRWEGQVATLSPGGPCYRCIFPERPDPSVVLDCRLTGVLGAVVGVLGTIQAVEAMKLLVDGSSSLTGKLLLYDARNASFDTVSVARNPDCPSCGHHRVPRLDGVGGS